MGLAQTAPIEQLRQLAEKLGRKGVAEEAIKAMHDCGGSYKEIMELAGKLSAIAKMSTFDEYWQEQVNRGIYKMNDRVEILQRKEV